LSEFKLNDDLDNLNQTLEGQKNILQSLSGVESEFRQVQARMNAAGLMIDSQLGATGQVKGIVDKMPSDVKLNSIRVFNKGVSLEAETVSEESLGSMLGRLANDPQWTDVKLTDLATDNGAVIKFALALDK
jgi:hypothetical protein